MKTDPIEYNNQLPEFNDQLLQQLQTCIPITPICAWEDGYYIELFHLQKKHQHFICGYDR